jgi:capsular polysaccharide biosynthesis protein
VAAAVAAGLVAAVLVMLAVPSSYRASGAVILVREGRPPGADPELAGAVRAAEELLQSRAVADSAVSNLELEGSPEELLDDVRVSAEPDASLVRFSVDAGDGGEARRIAQELAEVFTVLYNGRFGPATTASIWEAPQAEEGRVSPRPAPFLGVGAALGLLTGVGLAAARRAPRETWQPEPVAPLVASPEPEPERAPPPDRLVEKRLAAVTARELALARRAAELALKERELEAAVRTPEEAPVGEPEPEPHRAAPFVEPSPVGWTVGDVERLLAEQRHAFPERLEELGYYLDSFRAVAGADGRLPAGVEVVVEDVFAELLARSRRMTD